VEILIGLAVATVLLIGLCRGNLFASVFATIPVVIVALVGVSDAPNAGAGLAFFAGGAVLSALIWAPRIVKARSVRVD
jgi:hypothetical protein